MIYFKIYLYVHVCGFISGGVFSILQRPEDGVKRPGTGVRGDCGPSDIGAGNLYKTSKTC